jgi:hypothetical protein
LAADIGHEIAAAELLRRPPVGREEILEELYPNVVDGPEEEGGVPSRLIKTDRRKAEKEGTPWWMFAGSR